MSTLTSRDGDLVNTKTCTFLYLIVLLFMLEDSLRVKIVFSRVWTGLAVKKNVFENAFTCAGFPMQFSN